jgi:enolase
MVNSIENVSAWQALDSRGDPTVAIRITLGPGISAVALAPAGASAGGHEAPFIRDGGESFGGRSVSDHLRAITPALREGLVGVDADDPEAVHEALQQLDGHQNWSFLGGNVGTAASVATWLAVSQARKQEPWEVISSWTTSKPELPMPMVNIISGGAHAGGSLDVQDILAIPAQARTVEEAIEAVWRVRLGTREIMNDAGYFTALVADEGGLAASFPTNTSALKAVNDGAHRAGLEPGSAVLLALDVAANELHRGNGTYNFEGNQVDSSTLIATIEGWVANANVVSVEDPLSEDDDWSPLSNLTDQIRVVGDDRYATSVSRLEKGIEKAEANSVLIKVNQAGSLWSALATLRRAKESGWHTIVSARSGDTEESWLVDLAVGSGAGQIKVGSTMRSERTAKWNRMLELAHLDSLPFAELAR